MTSGCGPGAGMPRQQPGLPLDITQQHVNMLTYLRYSSELEKMLSGLNMVNGGSMGELYLLLWSDNSHIPMTITINV
jgi:hypothetical protein